MNQESLQRFIEVNDQLMSFTAKDATPVDSFDIEPVYGLIASIPPHITQKIKHFSDQLQAQFPDQYYYAPSQYHLTVIPIPRSLEVSSIVEMLSPVLGGWHMPIRAYGFSLNRLQVSTVLYPQNESLLPMRMKLREALGTPQQAFTEHRVVWEELLWTNFMRFTSPPSEELISMVQAHARDELGAFMLDRLDLYEIATKTLDPSSSKLLHTFAL